MWKSQPVLDSELPTHLLCSVRHKVDDERPRNHRNFIFAHPHDLTDIERLIEGFQFKDKTAIKKNGNGAGSKGNQRRKVEAAKVQGLSQLRRPIHQTTIQGQKDRVESSLRESQGRHKKEHWFGLEVAGAAGKGRHSQVERELVPNEGGHQNSWIDPHESESGDVLWVEGNRVRGSASEL